jgi:hypothetical protein
VQQGHKVGNDTFHGVCDKHLVAVELNLVFLNLQIAFDFGKVQNSGEVKRIIHIEMDVKLRVLSHRIELPVELIVIFLLEFSRFEGPCRGGVVDDTVFVGEIGRASCRERVYVLV